MKGDVYVFGMYCPKNPDPSYENTSDPPNSWGGFITMT